MTEHYNDAFHQIIKKQLSQREFDVIGIVPLPSRTDRMVRLRTLQEIIEDFDESGANDTIEYLIQIKPKRQLHNQTSKSDNASSASTQENIYLSSGKLNLPFLIRNGDLLLESGDYVLARNIYKTILRSGENTGTVLFRMGKCLELEGKLEEARAQYDEALAYHPTLECYQRLSALLISQKKDAQAAEVLERALNLKDIAMPIRLDLHKATGNCWTRAQKSEEAEKHFKKALEIDPTGDDIRFNLGSLYLQNNKISEARRNFRDAIASNPRNAMALAGLGSCFLSDNDKKSAHDCFAQSLDIELNNPTALFHLVKCAYEIKIYATAARILSDYIQTAPVTTNLLYSLAGLQYHLGRIADAKATTLRILELQPEHAGAKELMILIGKYTE